MSIYWCVGVSKYEYIHNVCLFGIETHRRCSPAGCNSIRRWGTAWWRLGRRLPWWPRTRRLRWCWRGAAEGARGAGPGRTPCSPGTNSPADPVHINTTIRNISRNESRWRQAWLYAVQALTGLANPAGTFTNMTSHMYKQAQTARVTLDQDIHTCWWVRHVKWDQGEYIHI